MMDGGQVFVTSGGHLGQNERETGFVVCLLVEAKG